jgi:hypothetical protein
VSEAPSSSPSSEPTTDSSGSSPKESLLDAVLKVVPATNETDVLAEPKEPADPDTPTDDQPDEGQADAAPDDDDDQPAEEAAATPPALRKKINKLLTQRRELRAQVQQLEGLRPSAEVGAQMQSFATENNLSGEDVATMLKIGAFLRHGDYASFYKAVAPFVRTAQEYLGLAIPKDLRDRVSQGHMTEQTAREFARERMDRQRTESVLTTEQASAAKHTLQLTQAQVQRSVAALEQQMSASDPDYRHKAASVRRAAQAMLYERGGQISTVEEALEITRAAYAEVNATIRGQRPPPRPTSPQPNGNGQTRNTRAEPSNMFEAALQGLERSRANGAHP